jgi:putative membrane protein
MSNKVRNQAIWGMILLFALFNALKPLLLDSAFDALIPAVSILSMLGFVLLHGPRQIGWTKLVVFFVIAFIVSWGYESLSIKTGFPFGHYHYTDRLGPKLGDVPLLIMPAYFAICYVSWHLAHVVLDKFDPVTDRLQTWAVPVLAGLIMVMWDMSMDPATLAYPSRTLWAGSCASGRSFNSMPSICVGRQRLLRPVQRPLITRITGIR